MIQPKSLMPGGRMFKFLRIYVTANTLADREVYKGWLEFGMTQSDDGDYFWTISTNRTGSSPETLAGDVRQLMFREEKRMLGKSIYTLPAAERMGYAMLIEEGSGSLHAHGFVRIPKGPLAFNPFKMPLCLEERVFVAPVAGIPPSKYRIVKAGDDVGKMTWRRRGMIQNAAEERYVLRSRDQYEHGETWRLIQPVLNCELTAVAKTMTAFRSGDVQAYPLRSLFADRRFDERRVHLLAYMLKECRANREAHWILSVVKP